MDVDTILRHPNVAAVRFEGVQNLVSVFIRAFNDNKNSFPIDFDIAWQFLGYSSKANAVKKLKNGLFKEGVDYHMTKERKKERLEVSSHSHDSRRWLKEAMMSKNSRNNPWPGIVPCRAGTMEVEAVLAHPNVASGWFEGDHNLAAVFLNAFYDERVFSISFDDVWRFLGYTSKASEVKKLKREGFKEGSDYVMARDRTLGSQGLASGGRPSDNYFMTPEAFENFAISALTERGSIVQNFFIAVKQTYFTILEETDTPGALRRAAKRLKGLVDERNPELIRPLKLTTPREQLIRDSLASSIPVARTEVQCIHGRVDILTDAFVIEVKQCSKWKAALGQCLAYRDCFPGREAKMVLFGTEREFETLNIGEVTRLCTTHQATIEQFAEGATRQNENDQSGTTRGSLGDKSMEMPPETAEEVMCTNRQWFELTLARERTKQLEEMTKQRAYVAECEKERTERPRLKIELKILERGYKEEEDQDEPLSDQATLTWFLKTYCRRSLQLEEYTAKFLDHYKLATGMYETTPEWLTDVMQREGFEEKGPEEVNGRMVRSAVFVGVVSKYVHYSFWA